MRKVVTSRSAILPATALCILLVGCLAPPVAGNSASGNSASGNSATPGSASQEGRHPADANVATFASGCFWCVEAIYESVNGVYEAVSGYAGGTKKNPTYEQVSQGATQHAEAVQIFYDADVVSFAQLIDVFFASQNPTQVNGQGPDRGAQYRSIIFYATEEEQQTAVDAKVALDASGTLSGPAAAEITKLDLFWLAEEYHQDFERRNPNQRYIQAVSIPRLKKFQAKRPDLLKPSSDH